LKGDSNLDGRFDSSDLVHAFKYGNYDSAAAAVLALDDDFGDSGLGD